MSSTRRASSRSWRRMAASTTSCRRTSSPASPTDTTPPVVPASEIIHDRWNCLFHPLVGISPLYAMAGAVAQAKLIQDSGTAFFAKGGRPGGVLIAPTKLDPLTDAAHQGGPGQSQGRRGACRRTRDEVGTERDDRGRCPGDSATRAGRRKRSPNVSGCRSACSNSSKQPPYANAEASQLQYKSQCLECHLISIQNCLDVGPRAAELSRD